MLRETYLLKSFKAADAGLMLRLGRDAAEAKGLVIIHSKDCYLVFDTQLGKKFRGVEGETNRGRCLDKNNDMVSVKLESSK